MDHGPNFRCLSAVVGRFIRPASAGRGDSRHFPIGDFADPNRYLLHHPHPLSPHPSLSRDAAGYSGEAGEREKERCDLRCTGPGGIHGDPRGHGEPGGCGGSHFSRWCRSGILDVALGAGGVLHCLYRGHARPAVPPERPSVRRLPGRSGLLHSRF